MSTITDDKVMPSLRRKARSLAVQALYQWEVTRDPINLIELHFLEDTNLKKLDVGYFSELLHGVVNNIEIINDEMIPVLDRDLEKLNTVELSILRLAIFELLKRLDVPYRVVINEALELAKIFGSQEGFKYVNGVLDKVAKKIRINE